MFLCNILAINNDHFIPATPSLLFSGKFYVFLYCSSYRRRLPEIVTLMTLGVSHSIGRAIAALGHAVPEIT